MEETLLAEGFFWVFFLGGGGGCIFAFFLEPLPWHMEVPRLGV